MQWGIGSNTFRESPDWRFNIQICRLFLIISRILNIMALNQIIIYLKNKSLLQMLHPHNQQQLKERIKKYNNKWVGKVLQKFNSILMFLIILLEENHVVKLKHVNLFENKMTIRINQSKDIYRSLIWQMPTHLMKLYEIFLF